MDFNNKLPEWKNKGIEPSSALQSSGFAGGDKPPATVFNWFWSKVCAAITELQNKLSSSDTASNSHASNTNNPHEVTAAQVGAPAKGNLFNNDLNTAITPGIYRFNTPSANGPGFDYGQILVMHGDGDTISQVAFDYMGDVVYRSGNPAEVGGSGTWSPWYKLFGSKGIVPITNGGTGATTAAGALLTLGAAAAKHKGQHNRRSGADPVLLSDVAYLGQNPIDLTTTETDLIEAWADMGSGYAYYAKEGDLGTQLSRYGQLINYVTGGDVFQLWVVLPAGGVYWRSGSGTTWATNWAKFYDSGNLPSIDKLGGALADHTHTTIRRNGYDQAFGFYGVAVAPRLESASTLLDDTLTLGWSTGRFKEVYATTGTIKTSDAREKNTIADIDKAKALVMAVRPRQFKYNNGTRTHYGFVAQEFEADMQAAGIEDCAALIKCPKDPEKAYSEDMTEDEIIYGMRSAELIAPLFAVVQEQEKRIADLEKALHAQKEE